MGYVNVFSARSIAEQMWHYHDGQALVRDDVGQIRDDNSPW